jgi:apolipoprotein N-acyltransferase
MDKENYNAALVYHPNTIKIESYEKRVLLPIVEYFPFSWVKNLAAKFGITGAYTHGSTNKIFAGKIANFSISICYEETFGHLLHDNRNIGAQLLVNISNDAWFPNSKLPKQHFDLGKIRTVENGLPLIRACNTGITAGINAFGETISILDKKENQNGLLLLNVPLASYPTLYSLLGDYLILSVSGLFILLFLFSRKHRKN